MPATPKQRVLSGMRPTGRLHIGHFFGALANWIEMQSNYECFFFVADWHALTSDYADTSGIAQNSIEIATDWLASGLDPAKCTMFVQSQVPEHAELQLLLSMVTPLGWLERVPTYKEALDNVKGKDLHTFGFLGYPVLQAADIVIYDADLVPVGEDQVAHVELTREIVNTFNTFYGFDVDFEQWEKHDKRGLAKAVGHAQSISREVLRKQVLEEGLVNFYKRIGETDQQFVLIKKVLREPDAMLTQTPRIPGTDGRKMSKSYNNFIALSEDDDSIRKKMRGMVTDPARKLRTDPGNPDVCPVFDWHKLFSTPEVIQRIRRDCTTAAIGCVDCKQVVSDALIKWIEPVRERRRTFESKPAAVLEILDEGSKKARVVAKATMERVREAVFGWKKTRESIASNAANPLKAGS
ncbi:MAG: tryptophan--tRNA ligase [Candidatus Acidiferrales bacterium]